MSFSWISITLNELIVEEEWFKMEVSLFISQYYFAFWLKIFVYTIYLFFYSYFKFIFSFTHYKLFPKASFQYFKLLHGQ